MKIFILLCVFCSICFLCNAQTEKTLSGDTVYWGDLTNKKVEKLHLLNLSSSTDKWHFRFWTDKQVVDIWTLNGDDFEGQVINYTNSYAFDKKKMRQKPSSLYSKKEDLDPVLSKKVAVLIKTVEEIPTDKLIKGWGHGFDGEEYILETATPKSYDFKNYWTPTAQPDSLIEAKKIQRFVTHLDSLLGLKNKYNEFFETLKPGSYTGDGPMITMKLPPKWRAYLDKTKPNRDYLDSRKDALNHFLVDTLNKIFKQYGALDCYDTFILTFSTKNELLDVTTNSELTSREDKKQYKLCRARIIAAFKLFKIDFIHSKFAYREELSFNDGKVSIYQNGFW